MNYEIGQKVAIQSNIGYQFGYSISKVTPKGTKITVVRESDGYERIFDKDGVEKNTMSSYYHRDRLVDYNKARVNADRSISKKKAARAFGEMMVVEKVRHTWGKESMENKVKEMEELLAKFKEAVEAIDE